MKLIDRKAERYVLKDKNTSEVLKTAEMRSTLALEQNREFEKQGLSLRWYHRGVRSIEIK